MKHSTNHSCSLCNKIKLVCLFALFGFTVTARASDYILNATTSETTVILNDLENHSWSYYSDPACPIRSLNPADVKITYYGNGIGTVSTSTNSTPIANSWTANATNVKVGIDAEADAFVYYKTLERTDGSTATSVEGATGRCEYTTIPNPFSVRPTNGSGSSRWRGFYGWRIKSITGGKIYSAATGGTEYTEYTDGDLTANNWLAAEGTYYFAPDNETGMEIELEALWARAYVSTSSMGNYNVGVERNFYVITSSENTSITASSYPGTYTSIYPNGTTDGTTSATSVSVYKNSNFTASADSKIEYIILYNNNYSITGAGYNLTIGRGVSSYNSNGCATNIYGLNRNANTAVNYTLRVESGSYTNFYMTGRNRTFYNTVSAKGVLGCDYDRAVGNNSNLYIANGNGDIYGGWMVTFTNASNRNNLTFDWTVKSGTYHNGLLGSAISGTESIYLGSSQAGNGNLRYIGKRRITVEGGIMASIAGGMNNSNASYGVNDSGWAVLIRMKGGHVRGSIYGAAGFAEAVGDRKIVFTGGVVNGWVAGGCNGTQTGNGGTLNGDTWLYVGGNVQVRHTTNDPTISTSKGGNIFGAGSGYSAEYAIGEVNNSTLVLADNALVSRGVYGGGNFGYVGSGYQTNIYVLGGTVGNVFGGSNQRLGQTVNIFMSGGHITDGLYGGSNVSGIISNNVTMQITGGQVGTLTQTANIYGGGYGRNTGVSGNVELNLGARGQTGGGVIVYGDVYGGSALGSVNTNASNNTTVNILNGTLNGDVYGGGLGDSGNAAAVNGRVIVNIGQDHGDGTYSGSANFGATSRVFGGNNTNGSPQDDVTVNIYQTAHNASNSYPNHIPGHSSDLVGATSDQFAIQAVYGGGNLADYAPENGLASSTKKATVHVFQCDQNTIKDVYGGSNQASAQNTHVIIEGGRIDRIFGGGNGVAGPAPVAGTAKTEVHAGLITQVYGGSNTNGTIGNIDLAVTPNATCVVLINEVFSGNNIAPIYGDFVTNLIGNCYDAVDDPNPDGTSYYGGNNLAPIYGNVTLNVYGGYYTNVFGGSKGDAVNNIPSNIMRFPTLEEVTDNPNDYADELKAYLTSHPDAYGTGGDVTLNIYGGKIVNAFGGSDMLGNIDGKITVNVIEGGGESSINHCGLDLTNVYGSGNETEYNPSSSTASVGTDRLVPEVNIKRGHVSNNVFGGGLGNGATVTANPAVTIGDVTSSHEAYTAIVGSSVYGGGKLAQVDGDTRVVLQKSTSVVQGNVYGGGMGSENSRDAGLVRGNTHVNVTGGTIKANIYGGGYMSQVADTAFVTVSGTAYIGVPEKPKLGKIFGASRGNTAYPDYALVSNTVVNIIGEAATFQNNVYGGGEVGAVAHNTNVTINGGVLPEVFGAGQGVAGTTGKNANVGGTTHVNILNGNINNVYGGGQSGTVRYSSAKDNNDIDSIATIVTMSGGTVNENVFGGGDQGTTQGRVIVNMNGGNILGELFGGAKGTQGQVYVAGLKTVNMRGGSVYNHVYGGSRNANDGNSLESTNSISAGASDYNAFVNISGGIVRGNVYGAGFFGYMFGSSDINIGKEAIVNANRKNIDKETHDVGNLQIILNVFAGSNWGDYDPIQGFGNSTTTGHSNIYVDGNGYDTESINGMDTTYMNIGGSLYGSGTSSEAGSLGRKIQVVNYGQPVLGPQNMHPLRDDGVVIDNVLIAASRKLQSIQRCDTIILDNASIEFTGQGDISQNHNTVEYSLAYINKAVFVRNGCHIVTNAQIDEIHSLVSQYRPDTYNSLPNGVYDNPSAYWIGIGAHDQKFYYDIEGTPTLLYDNPLDPKDTHNNTIRYNGGYSLYVRYKWVFENGQLVPSHETHPGAYYFGELKGFFRMTTMNGNETFAHARPKITSSKTENTSDGGFLSYYDLHNFYTDSGSDYTNGEQFPYINVTTPGKADRTDYRFWRIREQGSSTQISLPVALFLYSDANHPDEFLEVAKNIELSTPDCDNSYYKFEGVDYGDNAHLVDFGIYDPEANETGHDPNKYYIANTGTKETKYFERYFDKSAINATEPQSPMTPIDTLHAEMDFLRNNPNTYFGLMIYPDGCLVNEGTNKSWLLSENSTEKLVDKNIAFTYPNNHQGMLPSITLRITYYRELTMSAALAPVTVKFNRYCMVDGVAQLQESINIPIYITTQTELGQNIEMTQYAMFGDLATNNAKESYTVKATLPPFRVADSQLVGENIPFFICEHSFEISPSQTSTTGHIPADPTWHFHDNTLAATDHDFALTYQRSFNSDNKSGWLESVLVNNEPHNVALPNAMATPVCVGSSDGRNPFSIDFTLYYNSCEQSNNSFIYEPERNIGAVTYTMKYPITKAGFDANVPDQPSVADWKSFNIKVNIYKRDHSNGFYLDGVLGQNSYTGEYANYGKRTLQKILESGWKPGDIIYVVRPITIPENELIFSNHLVGSTVTLYRYPGKEVDPQHWELVSGDLVSPYVSQGIDNPGENTGRYYPDKNNHPDMYVDDGAIFAHVTGTGKLTFRGVVLDGMTGDKNNYPWTPSDYDLTEHSNQLVPLVSIGNGAEVVFSNGSGIINGNITAENAHGCAVEVKDGGTLNLFDDATITNNTISGNNGTGAAVYLNEGAKMNVGGNISIKGNTQASGQENNVYFSALSNVITIDKDNPLDANSKIGVTKHEFYPSDQNLYPLLYDLTPIATSEFPECIKSAYTYGNFTDDTERAYTHYYIANTLYFGKTWAHFADKKPDGFSLDNINSDYDLAWLISYVNGLNGETKHPEAQATITADIDLSQHFWKPIKNFKGTLDGQWNRIDGLTIKREGFTNIGMFDTIVDGGVVKNIFLSSSDIQPWNPDPVEQYAGGIAGTVGHGGTVSNCEVTPTLTAADANRYTYLGGAVGRIIEGGVVHSVFSTPNLRGYTMGGIVGKIENGGSLYNSYANINFNTLYTDLNLGNNYIGGLVGLLTEGGVVENCYVKTSVDPGEKKDLFGWFTGSNSGNINYCYAPERETDYVFIGSPPQGHGNYAPVINDIKALGYLYDDNKVTLATGQTNSYHSETLTYADGRIDKWPGMLSALSHWVTEKNSVTETISPYYQKNFTPWFRPNTTYINGDLPVLGVNDYVSLSTTGDDVNTLRYEAKLDGTLTRVNANTIDDSYVFLYGKDNNVKKVPEANVHAFINEDAVLIQDDDEGGNFEATVGITFDNSWGKAHDYFENTLEYDWHLMSTPLYNAPMGTTYNMSAPMFYNSRPNLTNMENGYFPNGLKAIPIGKEVKWDFYAYDEPDYHWVNFKRSTGNHWHIDTIAGVPNPPIHYSGLNSLGTYVNETEFVPGKGYMMAISQDSYLSNKGILNKGEIYVPLTAMAPTNEAGKPTYDKGSNLVGNPYQAYLDLEKVSAVNSTLKGYYFYNADSDNSTQGMYVPYTPGMSLNPIAPKQYIHPHQAFFVVTESDQTMTFDQSMATTNLDENAHFRNTGINYPLVNLVVSDTLGNGDLCIVEFKRPELGGVNKINNLRNADFKLYAHYENEDYGLLFTPTHAKRVPLFFKTPNNGKYTLSWNTHNGTFTSMYLVDNLTGVYYDMLANDKYTFEAKATDYASRFYIVFSVTDVDEYDDDDINDTFAYFNGYGWVIEGEGQLDLIDMLGHVLYSNVLSGESTLVHFDDIASGMYMLRLTKGNRVVGSQKIVIY